MPDLYLHPDGTGLLVTADGKLSADPACCCDTALAIGICNFNLAKDDNFKVLLNGNEIGTIDNNTNACTGRIFATDADVDDFSTLACNTAFQPTILISDSDFVSGTNTLRVESIQNNGNNNLGDVDVVRVQWNGSEWTVVQTFFNGSYLFTSGVGNGNDFTFSYP